MCNKIRILLFLEHVSCKIMAFVPSVKNVFVLGLYVHCIVFLIAVYTQSCQATTNWLTEDGKIW